MLHFDSPTGQHNNGAADSVITAWLEAAQRGAVLVTSNKRAARFLLGEFHRMARATGATGWATPSILTWAAWLQREWQRVAIERADASLLLSGPQEHALWLQIVTASASLNPYAHAGVADLAQQTWTLLHDYAMDLAEVRRASHARLDWEQFSRWADKFHSRLKKEQWMTQAQLAAELCRRLDGNQWRPPAELIAWGFDFFTPAQEALLQSMTQKCRDSRISRAFPSLAKSAVNHSSAAGLSIGAREDELRAASRWARLRTANNPNARLAIITTQAAEDRGALQRALSLDLAPSQFAFTLGHPLSQFPLVRTALLLLEFERGPLSAVDVSDLLLARELTGSNKYHEERALFEANVFRRRDTADPAMDLPTFTTWLRGAMRPHATSLLTLLRQCQSALRLHPKRNAVTSAEDWAEHFEEYLAAFHYPACVLNSTEYQAWESWQELLQGFAASGLSGEKLTHADALARLNHFANKTIFQPESGDAAVEIMGPLEAAGSLFDGIFFLGCTDNRWPLAAPLNPLLPPALQRAAEVPGAVAGATLDRAAEMTQRILNSAPEVIFSHAQRDKDGPLRPSPVLARLQIAPLSSEGCEQLLPQVDRAAPSLERADDTRGPEWAASATGRTLSTSALKSQAACPFQAFALHRLHARGQELPEEGFGPSQRGLLLHEALRRVWSKPDGLQTSAALHDCINRGTLNDFVRQRVEECLPPAQDGRQREYFQIERERLTRLICEWLTKIETKRAPFIVGEAEEEFFPSLGPSLKFRVRPDRVDSLVQDEALVLIDYKTGAIKSKEWLTPRMDEPQMPFYALFALDNPPAAIALASIRGGSAPTVKTVQAREDIFPGAKAMPTSAENFNACLADWQADLELLASDFAGGHALVDPKYGNTTCRYCTLQPLCRVHETEALLTPEEEEESEGADF